MDSKQKPIENCLKNGCFRPNNCPGCGFDKAENERRKKIPLVIGEDGLRRKIIHRKYSTQEKLEGTTTE